MDPIRRIAIGFRNHTDPFAEVESPKRSPIMDPNSALLIRAAAIPHYWKLFEWFPASHWLEPRLGAGNKQERLQCFSCQLSWLVFVCLLG